MNRIVSFAAAVALMVGFAGAASAQQNYYPDRYQGYSDRNSTYPSASYQDRNATYQDRYGNQDRYSTGYSGSTSNYRDRDRDRDVGYNDRYMSGRRNFDRRGMFASEADARSNCRSDSVVWVNTKSHVFHLPGTPKFGNTKHGAFMCRADAERSGTFRAARHEQPDDRYVGSSMPRR